LPDLFWENHAFPMQKRGFPKLLPRKGKFGNNIDLYLHFEGFMNQVEDVYRFKFL